MAKDLKKQFRNIPPGTLQINLLQQAGNLTIETGSNTIINVLNAGDHMAGLATVFQSLGLVGNLKDALPVFGPTTLAARKGGLMYDPEKGVQAIQSPASLNKFQN